MTHAERVREAERAVLDEAIKYAGYEEYNSAPLCRATDALLALRAATCPTCGGTGVRNGHPGWCDREHMFPASPSPCPAGCDNGRTR